MLKDKDWFMIFLMGATFVFLTVSGIVFKQSFLRMIPLYVSLIVAILQSRVNRYAPLIGGINSVIYAAVYAYYHLYASAAYALLVSCPLQIITFALWSKRPWQNSVMLKKLTLMQRIIMIFGAMAAWFVICHFLSGTASNYRELDTAVTILGIIATVLMMLSYYEYTFAMLSGGICSILLYIAMLRNAPEQATFLGYSIYSLICTIVALRRVRVIYAEQQK